MTGLRKFLTDIVPVLLLVGLCLPVLLLALSPPRVKSTSMAMTFPARKAVVLPVILSAYTTLDRGASHILAVSNIAREWGSYGVMGHIYPATEKLSVVGRMIIPEPEQLLRVHPDALLVHKQQSDVLRQLGMPGLVEIGMMPRNPQKSRFVIWQTIGRTTGNMARVMQLMQWDARQRAELHALLPAMPIAKRPRVLLVHVGKGTWTVPGGGYAMGSSVEEAGGNNLASSFRLTGRINLEQVLALDPDILLLDPNVMMSPYASSSDTTPQDIYAMPECRMLRAVRNRRVYQLPQHSYTNESIDDPLLLSWMAEIFYPMQLPSRIRSLYRSSYNDIYGYAISEEEIDQALFMRENSQSADYQRFLRKEVNE